MQTKLTKEQYTILTKYQTQLEQSTHNYTSHITRHDIEVLKPIYEAFGYHLTSSGCGGCILAMLKTLNKFYIEYIAIKNNNKLQDGKTKANTTKSKREESIS